jgi:hypothetical protein
LSLVSYKQPWADPTYQLPGIAHNNDWKIWVTYSDVIIKEPGHCNPYFQAVEIFFIKFHSCRIKSNSHGLDPVCLRLY